jgi:hypothetical protein
MNAIESEADMILRGEKQGDRPNSSTMQKLQRQPRDTFFAALLAGRQRRPTRLSRKSPPQKLFHGKSDRLAVSDLPLVIILERRDLKPRFHSRRRRGGACRTETLLTGYLSRRLPVQEIRPS